MAQVMIYIESVSSLLADPPPQTISHRFYLAAAEDMRWKTHPRSVKADVKLEMIQLLV